MTASSLRAGAEGLYALEAAVGLVIAYGTWLDLSAAVRIPGSLYRRLEERLAGAHDNDWFLNKHIADLEAGFLAAPPRGQGVPMMQVTLDMPDAMGWKQLPSFLARWMKFDHAYLAPPLTREQATPALNITDATLSRASQLFARLNGLLP